MSDKFSPDGYPLTNDVNASFNSTMDMHAIIKRLRADLESAHRELSAVRAEYEDIRRRQDAKNSRLQASLKAANTRYKVRLLRHRAMVEEDIAPLADDLEWIRDKAEFHGAHLGFAEGTRWRDIADRIALLLAHVKMAAED